MTVTRQEAIEALEYAVRKLEDGTDQDLRMAAKIGAVQEFVGGFIDSVRLPDPIYEDEGEESAS